MINKKYLYWIGLFLFLLFFHLNHLFNSDEGVVLSGAWNLINSKELYVDFFEFVAPGSFYLVFWVWKIFGVHYFVANFLAILFIFFSAIGIYKISQEISNNRLRYLPPLIFIISSFYWPIISYHTFNIFFIIWAVYFFIKGLKNYSVNNFIISGLLTSLSILFLQHLGIISLLALSFFLFILFLKEKKHLLLKLNFYYLIFSLSPLILLFIKWPAKLLYQTLIIFPLFNYTEISKTPFNLLIFFFIILLLTAWILKKEKSKKIYFLIFIQFVLLLSAIPLADIYHISLIIFPLYILISLSLEKLKSLSMANFSNIINIITLTIFFTALIIIASPSVNFIYQYPLFYSVTNSTIISYIKGNCHGSDYIYAGPFLAGLDFEARQLNPIPFSFLLTELHTKQQFLQAEEALKKHQPACAVLNYKMVEKYNYNKNNPVNNYIKNNYKLTFQNKDILVYKRND